MKYRAEGPHAIEADAAELTRQGDDFARHASDGSDSLDRIRRRFRLGRHRALFAAEDATPGSATPRDALRSARARMRARFERQAQRSGPRGRGAGRSARRTSPTGTDAMVDLAHVYRIEIPEGIDAREAVEALGADPHVEYAQPDFEMTLDGSTTPLTPPFDDPFLTSTGSWGQDFPDLWGHTRVGAQDAWARSVGQGTTVAVVDTGLDWSHPDIADNLWINAGEDLDGDGRFDPSDWNGIDDDGNGLIDDVFGFDFGTSIDGDEDGRYDGPRDRNDPDPFDLAGHGSHVTGTLAAVANNGEGLAGIAPGARVMALKGFSDETRGRASDLWRAVLYAAEMGAVVVNNSWSCGSPCPNNPLALDVLEAVEALGTVVVTSAGNAGRDVVLFSPENSDRVLTVGAIDRDDQLSPSSNHGLGIDVVAPGGGPAVGPGVVAPRRNILSLLSSAELPNEVPFTVDERYRRLSGTSMAAPHVAGAVALLASLRPELSPAAIRETIRASAEELGRLGHDSRFGAGVLDLLEMLDAPPVDVDLRWATPVSAALIDPRDEVLSFEIGAHGRSVARIEVAAAAGLDTRAFVPVESTPDSSVDVTRTADGLRAAVVWRVADLPDGPRVLRVRVVLDDGRAIERFRVIGLERIEPRERSVPGLDVDALDVAAGRIWWTVENDAPGAAPGDLDLALRSYRDPVRRPRSGSRGKLAPAEGEESENSDFTRFDVTGVPFSVSADGSLVAWRANVERRFHIAWCRLERGRSASSRSTETRDARGRAERCAERIVATDDGSLFEPHVGRGWILWQRNDGAKNPIEGCRVRRADSVCEPVPLVDTTQTRWRLRGFDGRTMVIQGPAGLATCVPSLSGPCLPDPITLTPGTLPPAEVHHDGRMFVIAVDGIGLEPPLGCVLGDFDPACRPEFSVTRQYRFCVLDDERVCDAIPFTPAARLERFGGVDVSGTRIAWSYADPLEEASIRFCDVESETLGCLEQRITGAIGRQDSPALDGARLAWRGGRVAGPSIQAHGLPGLRIPSRARVVAGRPFSIVGRARRGDAERLEYEVGLEASPMGSAEAEGVDSVGIGFRIDDPGQPGGRVRLRGRFLEDAIGEHVLLVRAVAATGIVSEERVRVDVRPPPNVEGRNRPRVLSWLMRWWRGVVRAHTPGL